MARSEGFLKMSEQLIEVVAECGMETEDTPYIRLVQHAAARVSKLLEDAVRTGAIGEAELFDENYRPVAGSNPPQHLTRFNDLADRLLPQVQEKVLRRCRKSCCAAPPTATATSPTHNRKYCQPQRPATVLWDTANAGGRRIFNDRTGLGSRAQPAALPAADLPPRHGRRQVRRDEGSSGADHRGRPPLGRHALGVPVLTHALAHRAR